MGNANEDSALLSGINQISPTNKSIKFANEGNDTLLLSGQSSYEKLHDVIPEGVQPVPGLMQRKSSPTISPQPF